VTTASGTKLTPLRPREFFRLRWSGSGEFRPRLGGHLFARRFHFRSETEFLDTEEWLVRDTTTFETGKTSHRTMLARLADSTHIKLSAEDMPRGAELTLEERGFSFRPYLLALPIVGPLRIRVRCVDRSRLDQDGALVDCIDMYFLRLPLGRVTMRLHSHKDR
jgi:hypothetical protein